MTCLGCHKPLPAHRGYFCTPRCLALWDDEHGTYRKRPGSLRKAA